MQVEQRFHLDCAYLWKNYAIFVLVSPFGSVNQHRVIRRLFRHKYPIELFPLPCALMLHEKVERRAYVVAELGYLCID